MLCWRMVKRAGVLLEHREFQRDYLLWRYMKDLVYSIPIDAIEILRERVENVAKTVRNNRGMLERVTESFRWHLHSSLFSNSCHFEHFL
jgi:hypothetical protein